MAKVPGTQQSEGWNPHLFSQYIFFQILTYNWRYRNKYNIFGEEYSKRRGQMAILDAKRRKRLEILDNVLKVKKAGTFLFLLFRLCQFYEVLSLSSQASNVKYVLFIKYLSRPIIEILSWFWISSYIFLAKHFNRNHNHKIFIM